MNIFYFSETYDIHLTNTIVHEYIQLYNNQTLRFNMAEDLKPLEEDDYRESEDEDFDPDNGMLRNSIIQL